MRGHLLLQLQQEADDAGLTGCPPELQALVQPLAGCIEAGGGLPSLLQLACSKVRTKVHVGLHAERARRASLQPRRPGSLLLA